MENCLTDRKEIPGAFAVLFSMFIIALFFDAAATSLFMLRFGWGFEIHPLFRWSCAAWGPVYGPMLGAMVKIAGGVFLATLHRRAACYILLAAAFISILAGFYNMSIFTIMHNGTPAWFGY